MDNVKKIKLQSGAELAITPSPFKEAKDLYQAVLEELKLLKLDPKSEVDVNFVKDLYCAGLSSRKIEEKLAACMKRVTYNGQKIDDNTFEPLEARGDYVDASYEVLKENISPFLKSLYAQFSPILGSLVKSLA